MIKRLLPLLLVASALSAAPINVLSYTLTGNGTNVASPVSQNNGGFTLSTAGGGGLSFYGNVVLLGAGNPISLGEAFDGPLELRFTDAVVSCKGTSFCFGSIDLSAFLFVESSLTDVPYSVGIEGTATGDPLFGFMDVFGGTVDRFGTPILVGGGNVSVEPSFSYSFPSTSGIPIAANVSLALSVAFNAIAPGTTINLPNSAWLAVGEPGSAIPEPGTILLLGAGLAGFLFFRRR